MSTATEMVQALETAMVKAQETGNEAAFVAARNRRQAYWDYRDGKITLDEAKYRLGKMPVGSRTRAPAVCLNWDGEVE